MDSRQHFKTKGWKNRTEKKEQKKYTDNQVVSFSGSSSTLYVASKSNET